MAGSEFDDPNESGPWPAFADLLSATTLLFLILFAAIAVPALGENERIRDELDALRTFKSQVKHKLEALGGGVTIEEVGDYLVVQIPDSAVFPRNRYELSQLQPLGRSILEEFGERIREDTTLLERIDQIHVVGHTSVEGPDSTNWRLSSARAATVALFLIDSAGIHPCRISALGRSRYYPVDPGDAQSVSSPDPADRRIELEVRPGVMGRPSETRRTCIADRVP